MRVVLVVKEMEDDEMVCLRMLRNGEGGELKDTVTGSHVPDFTHGLQAFFRFNGISAPTPPTFRIVPTRQTCVFRLVSARFRFSRAS